MNALFLGKKVRIAYNDTQNSVSIARGKLIALTPEDILLLPILQNGEYGRHWLISQAKKVRIELEE